MKKGADQYLIRAQDAAWNIFDNAALSEQQHSILLECAGTLDAPDFIPIGGVRRSKGLVNYDLQIFLTLYNSRWWG